MMLNDEPVLPVCDSAKLMLMPQTTPTPTPSPTLFPSPTPVPTPTPTPTPTLAPTATPTPTPPVMSAQDWQNFYNWLGQQQNQTAWKNYLDQMLQQWMTQNKKT
jgi:hypothetical protein